MNFNFFTKKKAKHKKEVLEKLAFNLERYRKQELLTFIRQGKYHKLLKDHEDKEIRTEVAFRAKPEVSATMIHTLDSDDLKRLIDQGAKSHLDEALNHDNHFIRHRIPKHGHEDHLDVLVYDKKACVREEVARYGLKRHLDILLSDDDKNVRLEVAKRGFKDHLDVLKYDFEYFSYGSETLGQKAQWIIEDRTKNANFASEHKIINWWRSIPLAKRNAIVWIPTVFSICAILFGLFLYFR